MSMVGSSVAKDFLLIHYGRREYGKHQNHGKWLSSLAYINKIKNNSNNNTANDFFSLICIHLFDLNINNPWSINIMIPKYFI